MFVPVNLCSHQKMHYWHRMQYEFFSNSRTTPNQYKTFPRVISDPQNCTIIYNFKHILTSLNWQISTTGDHLIFANEDNVDYDSIEWLSTNTRNLSTQSSLISDPHPAGTSSWLNWRKISFWGRLPFPRAASTSLQPWRIHEHYLHFGRGNMILGGLSYIFESKI